MNSTPKVSIIVPVYNREKYLRQCVDSIVAQTLKEIEIILVDDGSTDGSPAICDEYAARDLRVKVIHQQNAGMGVTCNTGMAEAKGEYIGFVESDDWIEPEMYKELYFKAVEQNVDVVKSLYTSVRNGKSRVVCKFNKLRDCNIRCIDPLLTAVFCFGHPSHWSAIYRRSFIEGNSIQFPTVPGAMSQDAGFNWSVYVKMRSYFILPKSFYNYREDLPDQSTAKGYKSAMMALNAHRLIYEWNIQNNTPEKFLEVSGKAMSLLIPFNFKSRCRGLKKLKFLFTASQYLRDYAQIIKLERLDEQQLADFRQIAFHPLFYCLINTIFKHNYKKNYESLSFWGIKLYEKKKTDQYNECKLFYLPIKKEVFDKQRLRIFFLGLPLLQTEEKNNLIKKSFLGIRYKTKQCPVKPAPYANDVRMLRAACYANAIAETHKRTFPKYKDSLRGQDIMVVACGPTANFAPILPNIKHLAVNRSITIKKYHFDFCFMIDYPAVQEFISMTFDYGCVNFFGKYVYDRCSAYSIPDSIAELAHAERFYSEVPVATHAYHDIEYFPLTDFGTVVHCALSFLFYTRPRRIYLVGCDTANTGYFEKNVFQKPININLLKSGYVKLKQIRDIYYPEIEIVSINPVGLKGMFSDMYTKSYLREHPEINQSSVRVLEE